MCYGVTFHGVINFPAAAGGPWVGARTGMRHDISKPAPFPKERPATSWYFAFRRTKNGNNNNVFDDYGRSIRSEVPVGRIRWHETELRSRGKSTERRKE